MINTLIATFIKTRHASFIRSLYLLKFANNYYT